MIVGTHVDDDIVATNEWADEHLLPKIKQRFGYKPFAEGAFVHCGRRVVQHNDFTVELSQRDYALSLTRIDVSLDRRRQPWMMASPDEISALRAGNGKLAWLARHSRIDLMFDVALGQQRIAKATVDDVLRFNRVVTKAKRDAHLKLLFPSVPFDKLAVIAWSDASFANVDTEGRE